jgi:WD40 repeat protein
MGSIFSARFHSGGGLLAIGAGTQVIVLDVTSGTRILEQNSASAFGLSDEHIAVQSASAISDRKDWPIQIYKLLKATAASDSESTPTLVIPTDGVRMMSIKSNSTGEYLAACGTDRTVRLWNARTGQLLNSFKGHENVTHVVAFSPNGQFLACASMDGLIKIWPTAPEPVPRRHAAGGVSGNSLSAIPRRFAIETQQRRGTRQQFAMEVLDTTTGKVCTEIPLNEPVYPILLNADATRIAAISRPGIVYVWDAQSGTELWQSQPKTGEEKRERSTWLDFSPDGRLLACGGTNAGCSVLDAVRGELIWAPSRLDAGVRNVKFNPAGTQLMAVSREGVLTACDVARRRTQWTQEIPIDRAATLAMSNDGRQVAMGNVSTAIAFSADGRQVAVGASAGRVMVCDAETGRPRLDLTGHALSVEALAFAPDGNRLASYGVDRAVKLWDLRSGRELGVLETDQEELHQLAFVDDGYRLLGVGPKSFVSWDARPVLQTGLADLLPFRVLSGSKLSVLTVSISPDGSSIAAAGYDKAINLWDTTTGLLKQKLTGHQAVVRSAVFSSDGQRLYSASADNTIRIWDVSTGETIETLSDKAAAFHLALSPDERWLAAGSSETAPRVWSLQTKQITLEPLGHTGSALYVDMTPNGKLLATGCRNGIVKLWDAEASQLLQTLPSLGQGMGTLRLSPDGSLLATSIDASIEVRKIPLGELAMQFTAPKPINSAAFSADGRRYAVASGDGNVCLWDVPSGRFLQMLRGGGQSVVFSLDGQQIVSGGSDGRVCVFQLDEELLSRELDKAATKAEPDRFGFGRTPFSGRRPDPDRGGSNVN